MLNNKQVLLLTLFSVLLGIISYVLIAPAWNNEQRVQLPVKLLWQGDSLDCGSIINTDAEDKTVVVEQLQFFISDIEFGSSESGWLKAPLKPTPYQSDETVFLGTNCRETSQQGGENHDENWTIEFASSINLSEASAMRFTLGVPFSVNHLNPISQKSPLNLPSMFWVWQSGHKFIRLELAVENQPWLFHLGSTGCQSSSVMRAPKQACRYPNKYTFELSMPVTTDHNALLAFDLAALLSNVELSSSASCQSERDNVNCQQLFQNLSVASDQEHTMSAPRIFKLMQNTRSDIGVDLD